MSKKDKKNKKSNYLKKQKKSWVIFVVLAGIAVLGLYFVKKPAPQNLTAQTGQGQCSVSEMTFYYLDQCSWCQKVKKEGTIEKIKQLGVKVKEINAAIGPIRHKFQGVPTFVINEKVYTGYKTFEDLQTLLGCPNVSNQAPQNQDQSKPSAENQFFGEWGESVILTNGEIKLDAQIFDGSQARFYNTKIPEGKIIYFFVIKDKRGIYRAAANACQVCFGERKGFHQEGDEIVCNNCGNRYPMEKIATEKGGCNPGPINPNLEIQNGQIVIKQADLEQVSELF